MIDPGACIPAFASAPHTYSDDSYRDTDWLVNAEGASCRYRIPLCTRCGQAREPRLLDHRHSRIPPGWHPVATAMVLVHDGWIVQAHADHRFWQARPR